MTSMPPPAQPSALWYMPPESWPNYEHIITEEKVAVESYYADSQMRLLTSVLHQSWVGPGEGRPYVAVSNVGLFYSFNEPPVVPDMMLSFDVVLGDLHQKKYRSYFVWEYGKAPDVVVEIVSGTEGDELGRKRHLYEKIGIPYYVVWDPELFLSEQALTCFIRAGSKFTKNGTWLEQAGLGVTIWQGVYENREENWLRWCDREGAVLPTGVENIQQEKARAEQEKARAEKLAAQLRALGVDPDQP